LYWFYQLKEWKLGFEEKTWRFVKWLGLTSCEVEAATVPVDPIAPSGNEILVKNWGLAAVNKKKIDNQLIKPNKCEEWSNHNIVIINLWLPSVISTCVYRNTM
jgi:hypothetical protein